MKLDPVTSRGSITLPATALDGERRLTWGTGLVSGFVTVKLITGDVPPPGAGFLTEMFRVAACAKSLDGRTVWRSVELA